MKKALIFPYDISNLHFIIYNELLPDMLITECVTLSGWGYTNEDAGDKFGVSTGITVSDYFEAVITKVDLVIITESILPLDDQDVLGFIYLSLSCKKEVIILREFQKVYQDKLRNQNNSLVRILSSKGKAIKTVSLDIIKNYKMKDVPRPIITILGTGENCNKFEIQLEKRSFLLKKGYKVMQVGTKKFSEFYGCHAFPDFMSSNKWSTTQKILGFNYFINTLCDIEKPDIIIIGVPGGIDPYDMEYHNEFGIMNFLVANAIQPDYVILSLLYLDFIEDYAKNLVKSLKYKYQYEIDDIFVSNTGINWIETKAINEIAYISISFQTMKKIRKKGFYNIFDDEDREVTNMKMLEALGMYGDMELC